MDTILRHQKTSFMRKSGLFSNLSGYDGLEDAIIAHALQAAGGDVETEDGKKSRADAIGYCFEVYAEFFLRRFGTDALVGVHGVADTSVNEHQAGFDLVAVSPTGETIHIQVKHRGIGMPLDFKSLGSFLALSILHDAERILFSNRYEREMFSTRSEEVFPKIMRLFGREMQERLIGVTPDFWKKFGEAIQNYGMQVIADLPPRWPHQQQMLDTLMKAVSL